MCGIYGIAGNISDTDKKTFMKMGNLINYRGPDDEGAFISDNALIGMRRLSIIDLTTGHQPIFNENKNLCIVCNGEIYNYKELKDTLLKKGHKFTTNTDTEVLLHLFEEQGNKMLDYLRGMYAFAIWNNNERKLFLARDRFGKKPLYYSLINDKLIFGSEVKIILSHPEYKKEINTEALYHYFSFKNIPSPLSIFKSIYSLPSGHYLTYHKDKILINKYWKIDFSNSSEKKEKNIINDLYSSLVEAVELRTFSSDVTVGAYLSGGVDSSLVVGLMSKICPGRIKTFSLAYKAEDNPDIPFAKKVSQLFNTEHYEYELSINEIIDSLDNIIHHFDEPFAGVISNYFLTNLISKHVKVALSGDGADELFASYLSHRLTYPIHNYINAKRSGNLSNIDWQTFENGNTDFVIKNAKVNIWDWRSGLFPFNDDDKKYLFNEKFNFSTKRLIKKIFSECTAADPLNQMLEMEIQTQLTDQVLTYVDRLSMAHSVEIRCPFLDQVFAEKAAKVHGNLKIKGSTTKYIFKKLAEKVLPKDIIYRPKKGFILPFHKWFKHEMKDIVLTTLNKQNIKKTGYLNYEYVNNILNEFYGDKRDNTYRIWTLMMFVLWQKKYFPNGL